MHYQIDTLTSGLRVLTIPVPSIESMTVTLWANVGSRYETAQINGISHFIEHMVFKGTTKRPGARIISEAVDSFGGELNAGTGKEWTNFYIKARKAKLDDAFEILSDAVTDPLLLSEEIDKERGAIQEEIKLYEDTPIMNIGHVFEKGIFKGNPLGWDISGTHDTVATMQRNDFVRYRKRYYGSNTLLVTVAGGVTPEKVNKLASEHLSGFKKVESPKAKPFVSTQKKPHVMLHSKQSDQAHFILGFLGHERGHKDRFVEAILMTILGSGMSSRLFAEVREKRGLAYSVHSGTTHYEDTGYVETYAGVNTKKIEEALKVTLDQHYGLASGKYEIEGKELTKAKEFLKGHIALSLEDTHSLNRFFGIRLLKQGKVETPQDVYDGLDAVTHEDVVRVANELFVPERLNLAVIGPYKDKKKLEKALL